MNIFQTILLAIIQAITEFIPVSSSAHLVIAPKILNFTEQSILFDIVLHGGTLLAVILYYRQTLSKLLFNISDPKSRKLVKQLILATIPALVLGLPVEKHFLEAFKNFYLMIFMLISIGFLFIYVDLKYKANSARTNSNKSVDITYKQAIIIGLSQPIAFIRGTSRSGITTIAGLLQNLDIENALNFSFLLSIPTIMIAFSYEIANAFILNPQIKDEALSNLIIGFLISFVCGYLAISFMLKIVPQIGLKWFGLYRIVLGLILILVLI